MPTEGERRAEVLPEVESYPLGTIVDVTIDGYRHQLRRDPQYGSYKWTLSTQQGRSFVFQGRPWFSDNDIAHWMVAAIATIHSVTIPSTIIDALDNYSEV